MHLVPTSGRGCWWRRFMDKPQAPRILWTAVFILVFTSSFFFSGRNYAGIDLDSSWGAVMEYAAERNLQFGVDVIFTTGPLGFLNIYSSTGKLLAAKAAFAFLWSTVISLAVIGLARRINGPWKLLFIIWILVFSNVGALEDHAYLVLAYAGMLWLGLISIPLWAAFLFLIAVGILALVKFTFFLATSALVAIIITFRLLKRNITGGLTVLAVAVGLLLLFWAGSGQRISGLPDWIRWSLEITSGYSLAMGSLPVEAVLLLCLSACLILLAGIMILVVRNRRDYARLGFLTLLSLLMFLSWKHGFVRASDHVFWFIAFVPAGFGFLVSTPVAGSLPARSLRSLGLMYALATLLCLGAGEMQARGWLLEKTAGWPMHMETKAKLIRDLFRAPGEYPFPQSPEQMRRAQEDARLPGTRTWVGAATVDVFNYLQMPAIFSKLNYTPRPVIQGYSAYTPLLQEVNLDYYRSDRRPRFVLFNMETIDLRFPTLDDARLLPFLLNNYLPVAQEAGFLLLEEAVNPPEQPDWQLVAEEDIAFGQALDISRWNHDPVFLGVEIRPSIWGQIARFLYRPPIVTARCSLDNAVADYRLIPSMASSGFLVSPLLVRNEDVLDLLRDAPTKRIQTITFVRPARLEEFRRLIHVRVFRSPDFLRSIRNSGMDASAMLRLKYPMFSIPPSSVEAMEDPRTTQFYASPALLVHAPGKITLPVPAGATELSGHFGILDYAYADGRITDGVEFSFVGEGKDGIQRLLFTRLARPLENPSDRGRLSFKIPVDSRRDARIILITGVGPKNDGSWDLSVWSSVKFDR
jgi:hypothetical protein